MSLNSVRMLYRETALAKSDYKPDGGWGWAVVFASVMISIIGDGYTYTTGQFYQQFLLEHKKSETATSLYISIMTGTIMGISPLASGLIKVYGCRFVSILGSLLGVIGMIASTIFDRSIYYHCITLGFITGAGLGLMFICQIVVVTHWFDKKLSFACGIAECGSGFGMAIFAVISEYFIRTFTWKGAMIILGGLMSTCISFSASYCSPNDGFHLNSLKDMFTWVQFSNALKETINFRVLKNARFTWFTLSCSILNFVFFTPIIVTSDRITNSGLGTRWDAAKLLVFQGLANGIGRILFGYIATFKQINRFWLYMFITVMMGIFIILTTMAQTYRFMALMYVFFGLCFGGNVCLCPVVLVDMLGAANVSNAYGILSFFNGVGAVLGPPLLNLMVKKRQANETEEITDGKHFNDRYDNAILIAGVITSLSGMMLLVMPCIKATPDITGSSSDNNNHNNVACIRKVAYSSVSNNNNNNNNLNKIKIKIENNNLRKTAESVYKSLSASDAPYGNIDLGPLGVVTRFKSSTRSKSIVKKRLHKNFETTSLEQKVANYFDQPDLTREKQQ